MEYYEAFTDEGLAKEWNRLETKKLNPDLECLMDEIQAYLLYDRGVEAWNHKGEITQRVER